MQTDFLDRVSEFDDTFENRVNYFRWALSASKYDLLYHLMKYSDARRIMALRVLAVRYPKDYASDVGYFGESDNEVYL